MEDTIKTELEFFAARIADGRQVNVFLTNGIKLQAKISAADEHCIFLQSGGDARFPTTSLVMKSAIASVIPVTEIDAKKAEVRDQSKRISISRAC